MLFCVTANYTAKALDAMARSPDTDRREAVEKLIAAAGGKLVAMYYTISEGPGAMVIFDVDPSAGPAVVSVIAASESVQDIRATRLFTGDEVMAIRKKRLQLQSAYKAPGQ